MDESTVAEAVARGNPVVFLDISIGGQAAGRISLELFKGLCPRAVRLFDECRATDPHRLDPPSASPPP